MPRFTLFLISIVLFFNGCGGSSTGTSYVFELVIRNIANPVAFTAEDGQPAVIAFSPALGVVHVLGNPMYTIGELSTPEFESFGEDGDFSSLIEGLTSNPNVRITVVGVDPAEEDGQSGVLFPDSSFRIVFNVEDPTAKISLALQYLQSNDVFVGTGSEGIALFDAAGVPMSQDVTSSLQFYDTGTELNQAPGVGGDRSIAQLEQNQGQSESNAIAPVNDGFSYPVVSETVQVSINLLREVS